MCQVNNVVVKKSVHPAREEGGLHSHVDLVLMLDIVDLEQGTTVAGKPICPYVSTVCLCMVMYVYVIAIVGCTDFVRLASLNFC